MNGDGYNDLIIGERDGYVNFFARNSNGTLQSKVRIQANGADIKVTNNSSPAVVDWNEDGLLDILVGSDASSDGIRLYLNSGTTTQYQFTTFTKIKANGVDIALSRCQIQVLDLNGDGKKDLVAGNGLTAQSRIYFYENTGTNAAPVLKAGVPLQKTDNTPVNPRYDVHFCFADWNEDGVPDLIYKEYSPNDSVHLYLGQRPSHLLPQSGFNHATLHKPSVVCKGDAGIIWLTVKSEQNVTIRLFDNRGRLVHTRHTGMRAPGTHAITIPLQNNHAGMYVAQYAVDNRVVVQKIMVIR